MSLIAVLALLAEVAGAAKAIAEIIEDLKALGLKPEDVIPDLHLARIQAAMASVPDQADIDWAANHSNA